MAGTVSWERLRELAGFHAERGSAISLFVGLDPSVVPTAADAEAHVRSLVSKGEKSRAATSERLSHEQRQGLKADFERIALWFDMEFEREGTSGVAVFADGLDGVWEALPLAESVPDGVTVGTRFRLAPLVPLVGRAEGAIVAVVSREKGEFFRLSGGRLEEVADLSEEQPGRHDQGGWSQARYQRHIEELVADHLRRVAEALDRRVRRLPGAPLVLVCAEEMRSEFAEMLSHEAREAIAGWTQADAHAGPPELREAALPVLENWLARQESEAVERWREEAGRNGRAAAGWDETLAAASDGRVELLLFGAGATRPAWQCPRCGRASTSDGSCPLDGAELELRDDAVDVAVHQTLAHGGTARAVTRRHDLDPVDGIGALLRY
jgi:peptide chain release factor subunit 1